MENQNNDVNYVNQTNTEMNGVQGNPYDVRGVEAEVLGELRKDKIGKPILVLEIAVLFAFVLIALPIVTGMLEDPESFLSKLLSNSNIPGQKTTAPAKWLDGSQLQVLGEAAIKLDNIVMEGFSLSNGKIDVTMSSYNGLLDLDYREYYLEIYSSNKNLVSYIKLMGQHDFQKRRVSFTREDMTFNPDMTYYGKIVEMLPENYENVTINSDESGIGTMTCKKGHSEFVYTFNNNFLIKIDNTESVYLEEVSTQNYMNYLEDFRKKADLFTPNSSVTEYPDPNRFEYKASVDLEAPGYILPDNLKDSNYYKLDTEAKIVRYGMIGKGYVCE